jgi:isopropylmalate/homocitrate/citramalate synthase
LPIQFHKAVIGENAFSQEIDEQTEDTRSQPLLYVPFPPEIIGREMQFYLGRQAGRKLIQNRMIEAGIRASPMQIEEVVRRMRRMHESVDKGEAQMTFYQIKRLMRDLRKGITEEDFWRVVEEVTRQKPKLPEKSAAQASVVT